jgi:helix-turn-helix protein
MDTLLIGRKEAARLLNLSLRSLDFAVGRGLLRARRLGRRVTFTPEELRRFAARDYKRIAPARAVVTTNSKKS